MRTIKAGLHFGRLLSLVIIDSLTRFLKTQVPYLLLLFRFKIIRPAPRDGGCPSVIISITSYPARFKYLRKTLISLLQQDVNFNYQIQVNLWSDEFKLLPSDLLELESETLKFFSVDENMRVFLKLIPTMRREPNLPIVTADDDIYYKSKWLKNLYREHLLNSRIAIGYRACTFQQLTAQHANPYSEWPRIDHEYGPSSAVFLTGVGGILYPPSWFTLAELDYSLPCALCPGNDDLWYYFLAKSKGLEFKKIFSNEFEPLYWIGSQKLALWKNNVANNLNDTYITNLLAHFNS